MHPRRQLLATATRALLLGGAGWAVLRGAQALPGLSVSLAQLQAVVGERFPRTVPLSGLLDLTLAAPQLTLLPEVNRIKAAMAVEAAGGTLRRSHSGAFDVEFGLRYEPSDRSLRAHQPTLGRLEFAGLKPGAVQWLNTYVPLLAEQVLGEVVLHRLRPQDTAMLDGLGLQPGAITVTPKGLSVALERARPG